MQCKVCQMPYRDPRFERDPKTGEPLYYRAPVPDHNGLPYVRDMFCGAAHSYLDYLTCQGQEVPEFLLAKSKDPDDA